jgi:hypothetical protein
MLVGIRSDTVARVSAANAPQRKSAAFSISLQLQENRRGPQFGGTPIAFGHGNAILRSARPLEDK